jgi:hypothetical protein
LDVDLAEPGAERMVMLCLKKREGRPFSWVWSKMTFWAGWPEGCLKVDEEVGE